MRTSRPTVTAGIVLFLLVLGVGSSSACDFPPLPPPEQAAEEADAVFAGTVTSVEPAGDIDVVATFDVDRVWRGPAAATIRVATPENPGVCGYPFEPGTSHLVYANQQDGALQTSMATRTTALDGADEDLRALGEGERPPAPDEERGLRPWAVAVVAVGLVVLVLVRRWGRSGTGDR